MSEIRFQEETGDYNPSQNLPTSPKIIVMAKKYSGGILRTDNQAYLFLIGFSIFALITSFLLATRDTSEAKITAPPGYEVIYSEDEPPYLQPIE